MRIDKTKFQNRIEAQLKKISKLESKKNEILSTISESSFINEMKKKEGDYSSITSLTDLKTLIFDLAEQLYEDYKEEKNKLVTDINDKINTAKSLNNLYNKYIISNSDPYQVLNEFFDLWKQDLKVLGKELIEECQELHNIVSEISDREDLDLILAQISEIKHTAAYSIKYDSISDEDYENRLNAYLNHIYKETLEGIRRRAGANLNFDNLKINDEGHLEGYVTGDKANCNVWIKDDGIYKEYKIALKSFK